MRLLATFVGGAGHLTPLLPVARAARAAGHEVAIAGSGGQVRRIEAAGFTAFATSPVPTADSATGPATGPASEAGGRQRLEVTDPRASELEFAANFADRGARRMAAAVPAIIEEFRPDLVLRDETDLGTTIAAELQDVPVACHLVLAAGLLIRPELVAPRLDAVRAEHGLSPDPGLTRLTPGLVLSQAPPSFRSPDSPVPLRPVHYRSTTGQAGASRPSRSGRRGIYVTLGTIFNRASGDLFERLLRGLAELDADIVATVGAGVDPDELGPQPPHVRVEQFVPQEELLPHVDLVVSHGGSGSLVSALAHGLPSLLLPLGADQPHNAVRAEELGVAAVLDPVAVSPAEVAARARDLLDDAAMRGRCTAVADEMMALPDVAAAIAALEEAAG